VSGSIDLAFGGFNDRIDRLELEAPAKRHWLMGPGRSIQPSFDGRDFEPD